jgi:hypothetical protein
MIKFLALLFFVPTVITAAQPPLPEVAGAQQVIVSPQCYSAFIELFRYVLGRNNELDGTINNFVKNLSLIEVITLSANFKSLLAQRPRYAEFNVQKCREVFHRIEAELAQQVSQNESQCYAAISELNRYIAGNNHSPVSLAEITQRYISPLTTAELHRLFWTYHEEARQPINEAANIDDIGHSMARIEVMGQINKEIARRDD